MGSPNALRQRHCTFLGFNYAGGVLIAGRSAMTVQSG
jgi:hypothetical protein